MVDIGCLQPTQSEALGAEAIEPTILEDAPTIASTSVENRAGHLSRKFPSIWASTLPREFLMNYSIALQARPGLCLSVVVTEAASATLQIGRVRLTQSHKGF